MKLNNRGWGYRMMAFLMAVLILFLTIAIIYINSFYDKIKNGGYNNHNNNSNYIVGEK